MPMKTAAQLCAIADIFNETEQSLYTCIEKCYDMANQGFYDLHYENPGELVISRLKELGYQVVYFNEDLIEISWNDL